MVPLGERPGVAVTFQALETGEEKKSHLPAPFWVGVAQGWGVECQEDARPPNTGNLGLFQAEQEQPSGFILISSC